MIKIIITNNLLACQWLNGYHKCSLRSEWISSIEAHLRYQKDYQSHDKAIFLFKICRFHSSSDLYQQIYWNKPTNAFFRSKSDITPLQNLEVWPEQVTLLEELGRGAFGKVHKAVLRDSPGVEVFDGKTRGTRVQFKEGRTIAVKVLSGKTISFSSLQNICVYRASKHYCDLCCYIQCFVLANISLENSMTNRLSNIYFVNSISRVKRI